MDRNILLAGGAVGSTELPKTPEELHWEVQQRRRPSRAEAALTIAAYHIAGYLGFRSSATCRNLHRSCSRLYLAIHVAIQPGTAIRRRRIEVQKAIYRRLCAIQSVHRQLSRAGVNPASFDSIINDKDTSSEDLS